MQGKQGVVVGSKELHSLAAVLAAVSKWLRHTPYIVIDRTVDFLWFGHLELAFAL
jgi:hypothetical protein